MITNRLKLICGTTIVSSLFVGMGLAKAADAFAILMCGVLIAAIIAAVYSLMEISTGASKEE